MITFLPRLKSRNLNLALDLLMDESSLMACGLGGKLNLIVYLKLLEPQPHNLLP